MAGNEKRQEIVLTDILNKAGVDIEKPVRCVLTGEIGFLKRGTYNYTPCLGFYPVDKYGIPKEVFKHCWKTTDADRALAVFKRDYEQYDGPGCGQNLLIKRKATYEKGYYCTKDSDAVFLSNLVSTFPINKTMFAAYDKEACVSATYYSKTKKSLISHINKLKDQYSDMLCTSDIKVEPLLNGGYRVIVLFKANQFKCASQLLVS